MTHDSYDIVTALSLSYSLTEITIMPKKQHATALKARIQKWLAVLSRGPDLFEVAISRLHLENIKKQGPPD